MSFKQLRSAYFKFPHVVPSAGVTTINATVGSWTWAGVKTGLLVIIAASVGAWTWAGKHSPLSTEIHATVGSWTWAGKASPLSTEIKSTVGTWSWAGNKSPLSTEVHAGTGAWTWAGVSAVVTTPGGPTIISSSIGPWAWAGLASPLSREIVSTVGSYTWAGLPAQLQGVTIIPAAIGAWAWAGLPSTIQGPPSPTVSTGSGGGGRYFGYYPERAREVRAEIRSLTKEKKRIERRFKLAPNNVDLARLAELLTQLQQRLNVLIAEYEELIHVQAKAPQAQEEDELFLVNLFSRSFYND
jgi:hypothetical protein